MPHCWKSRVTAQIYNKNYAASRVITNEFNCIQYGQIWRRVLSLNLDTRGFVCIKVWGVRSADLISFFLNIPLY